MIEIHHQLHCLAYTVYLDGLPLNISYGYNSLHPMENVFAQSDVLGPYPEPVCGSAKQLPSCHSSTVAPWIGFGLVHDYQKRKYQSVSK